MFSATTGLASVSSIPSRPRLDIALHNASGVILPDSIVLMPCVNPESILFCVARLSNPTPMFIAVLLRLIAEPATSIT